MRTDLFVYSPNGQKECHMSFSGESDIHTLDLTPGEKQIVAIVNSPYTFTEPATAKIESLEQIRFKFKDDSPEHPAMSGSAGCIVGEDTYIIIDVTPLLCSIELTEVNNNLTSYRLLENPRIRLTGINPEAEIMRASGFRPSGSGCDGEPAALPCDVGFYSQYPGTTLYCYPDETPENMIGTDRTELIFECEIQDTTRRFTVPLPPLPRGSVCPVSITVDETQENTYICSYVCSSKNKPRSYTPVR